MTDGLTTKDITAREKLFNDARAKIQLAVRNGAEVPSIAATAQVKTFAVYDILSNKRTQRENGRVTTKTLQKILDADFGDKQND